MGSDSSHPSGMTFINYFNPRSPHGERQYLQARLHLSVIFQSTLPAWGATALKSGGKYTRQIFQSTLPAWGATIDYVFCLLNDRFQSTLPAWGATQFGDKNLPDKVFQSTLPAWGATLVMAYSISDHSNFNPRSPHGERQYSQSIQQ